MRRSPVAYPTSRFRSLAQTDNENLQTQSPRNPVRLSSPSGSAKDFVPSWAGLAAGRGRMKMV